MFEVEHRPGARDRDVRFLAEQLLLLRSLHLEQLLSVALEAVDVELHAGRAAREGGRRAARRRGVRRSSWSEMGTAATR